MYILLFSSPHRHFALRNASVGSPVFYLPCRGLQDHWDLVERRVREILHTLPHGLAVGATRKEYHKVMGRESWKVMGRRETIIKGDGSQEEMGRRKDGGGLHGILGLFASLRYCPHDIALQLERGVMWHWRFFGSCEESFTRPISVRQRVVMR